MPLWSRSIRMGFRMVRRALPLALLPFAFDVVLYFLDPGQPLADSSVEFALPMAFPSLSQVYGQPPAAPPFFPLYTFPDLGQLTAPILLLFLGVQSYVTAGYLGALETIRLGGFPKHILKLANTFFSRIFAFNALIAVLLLVTEPFLRGFPVGPIHSIFILFAILLILYFLFLTPFCVAVDHCPLAYALRTSVQLAREAWREVLPFCLAYAAITVLVSASVFLLIDLPLVGLPLSAGIYSLIGTALVASALHLYDGLRPEEALPVSLPRPTPTEEAVST